jgi:DNA-binding transcriptional MerR regulator
MERSRCEVTCMAWSTHELADLAGTSLRTVRHYHSVGLLDEPERHSNGYKQYGVAHLVRVLRIKHLTDLGFALSQIAEMGDTDKHPEEALRTLDAELAGTIERLQRVRVELGGILRQSVLTDLPPDIASAAAGAELSPNDRSFIVVLTRLLGPEGLRIYADMLRNLPADPTSDDFENLPADADECTREELAERMATYARAVRAEHPGLATLLADAPRPNFTQQTVDEAMKDLYNRAQLDVVTRIHVWLGATPGGGYLLGRNTD